MNNWYELNEIYDPAMVSKYTVTRKFAVNSNGWYGEVAVQLSLLSLLLLTQPLNSSEQHTRANLEFSSDFGIDMKGLLKRNLSTV